MNKRLAEIQARKIEIRTLLEGTEPVDLGVLETELTALEAEETELRRRLEVASGIQVGDIPVRIVTQTTPAEVRVADKHDTLEYRNAFRNYVTRGTVIPVEMREAPEPTDDITGLSDISAVIPTTILNRIVQRMEESGRIWSRVTKTNVQGGISIPVSTAKPTAHWVAPGEVDLAQAPAITTSISFGYHKLQCRIMTELVAATVALPMFETLMANNIAEAMIKALDAAVIKGRGAVTYGEPLGIIADSGIPAGQKVAVLQSNFNKYETWTRLLGKVPRSYRSGVAIIMNDADWSTYIEGMVDANGQPVARVTYGLEGAAQEKFLGREVIAVEGPLPSVDTADQNDIVAIICKLSDYMVNSNMGITYRRYFDENTDNWVSKATMIADGKLADPNGVVLVKKG